MKNCVQCSWVNMIMIRKAKGNNENDNTNLLHRITGYIDGTTKERIKL